MSFFNDDRRRLIINGGLVFAGAAFLQNGLLAKPAKKNSENEEGVEPQVTPNEDLMREHGLLKRILLIYRDTTDRINRNVEIPTEEIYKASTIIRDFIQDYHEKLEEDYLFTRFKKAKVETELVEILDKQHEKGRDVIGKTLSLTKNPIKTDEDKRKLNEYLYSFVRMYEPHEAREDTILYPAFKKLVTPNEYYALGEEFEKIEHKKFGEDGFYMMIDRVATIEKILGLYDLDQFTPKT